jgi:hypothetical protein
MSWAKPEVAGNPQTSIVELCFSGRSVSRHRKIISFAVAKPPGLNSIFEPFLMNPFNSNPGSNIRRDEILASGERKK